jgi:hypothetical protein
VTSRLTVEAARFKRLAVSRIGVPEAIPRDISSRSARVRVRRERRRVAGGIPPRSNNKQRIELCGLYDRMTGANGKSPARPEGDWPDNTCSSPEKRRYFNGEAVVIMHMPANTGGNTVVFFRKSDVILLSIR